MAKRISWKRFQEIQAEHGWTPFQSGTLMMFGPRPWAKRIMTFKEHPGLIEALEPKRPEGNLDHLPIKREAKQ